MAETIFEYLDCKNINELRDKLSDMNPADIAVLFDELPEEKLPLFFRILPKELAADTFVEIDTDTQELLIQAFSDKELKDIFDDMYMDDVVDIIDEMPSNVVKRILKNATSADRRIINTLLAYPEDSAGSIMTIEYVNLHKTMTVAEAYTRIRQTGVDKETIYTCYVTDRSRTLTGVVSVKSLLLADPEQTIEELMEANPIYVNTFDDKEDVANKFSKYDFLAMPVVDKEQKLVGIITVDDAIDVITEEATEDIEKMAAITPSDKPYLKTGVFSIWLKRLPWLLLLMISATVTGAIIMQFEDALSVVPILTAYIPMLMGTGGNASSQASVTVIRGLALNEIEMRDILRVVWKEARVSILCGLTLSVCNFFKIIWLDKTAGTTIAFVVSLALFTTVFFAKLVGCALPIIAKKLKFDPAVMASPFITTIVDALSLLIYFRFASLLLGI